jgi:hypothetical protein
MIYSNRSLKSMQIFFEGTFCNNDYISMKIFSLAYISVSWRSIIENMPINYALKK